MYPLAELYPVLTENYGDIPEVEQGIIRIAWNYCVGEQIRNVTKPINFRDGILKVHVDHLQWQQALTAMKPEIIMRINKYLKKPLLADVTIEVKY